jgi:hypothetical protein
VNEEFDKLRAELDSTKLSLYVARILQHDPPTS